MMQLTTFRKLLTGAAMILAFANVQAQSGITEAYLVTNEITGQPGNYSATYSIVLEDSSGVSQLEIKLGSSEAGNNLASGVFNFDATTGLCSGCSYSRSGNRLTITLGSFTERSTYFSSVRLKDLSGNWSNPFPFISN